MYDIGVDYDLALTQAQKLAALAEGLPKASTLSGTGATSSVVSDKFEKDLSSSADALRRHISDVNAALAHYAVQIKQGADRLAETDSSAQDVATAMTEATDHAQGVAKADQAAAAAQQSAPQPATTPAADPEAAARNSMGTP